MPSDLSRPSRLSRAAEAFAWLLAFSAWLLSFRAQAQLAGEHGFNGWEQWLWPAGTDLAALACMLLALDATRRRLRTWEVWGLTCAATVVMVGANVAVDWSDPLGALMHAWPPVIAIGIWHGLTHGRRPHAEPVAAHAQKPERAPRPVRKPSAAARGERALALLAERADALRGDGHKRAAAIRAIAKEVGASPAHVRRLAASIRAGSTEHEEEVA